MDCQSAGFEVSRHLTVTVGRMTVTVGHHPVTLALASPWPGVRSGCSLFKMHLSLQGDAQRHRGSDVLKLMHFVLFMNNKLCLGIGRPAL